MTARRPEEVTRPILDFLHADRSGRHWMSFFRYSSDADAMIFCPTGQRLRWVEWARVFNIMLNNHALIHWKDVWKEVA